MAISVTIVSGLSHRHGVAHAPPEHNPPTAGRVPGLDGISRRRPSDCGGSHCSRSGAQASRPRGRGTQPRSRLGDNGFDGAHRQSSARDDASQQFHERTRSSFISAKCCGKASMCSASESRNSASPDTCLPSRSIGSGLSRSAASRASRSASRSRVPSRSGSRWRSRRQNLRLVPEVEGATHRLSSRVSSAIRLAVSSSRSGADAGSGNTGSSRNRACPCMIRTPIRSSTWSGEVGARLEARGDESCVHRIDQLLP